ncbi:MAG: phage holin [Clostridiales bacterium]|nr:phage holin [Clostridiales bacterium]
MEQKILTLVYDLSIVLVPILVGFLIELLRRKIGIEGMKRIEVELATKQELAALAVRFVEQVYRDLKGQEKYEQAAGWLATQAGELGLKVTPDEIKGLIEAAVRAFKDEFGEEWARQVSSSAGTDA